MPVASESGWRTGKGFDNEAADAFCSGLDIVKLNWHLDSKRGLSAVSTEGLIKDTLLGPHLDFYSPGEMLDLHTP